MSYFIKKKTLAELAERYPHLPSHESRVEAYLETKVASGFVLHTFAWLDAKDAVRFLFELPTEVPAEIIPEEVEAEEPQPRDSGGRFT